MKNKTEFEELQNEIAAYAMELQEAVETAWDMQLQEEKQQTESKQ